MNKTEVMALLEEHKSARGIENWKKQSHKNPDQLESFGIGLTQLRKLAKTIGRDHKLSQKLWTSNVYDAKVIALLIDDPKEITRDQIETQVEQLGGGNLAHVFATCGATLPKVSFAFDMACEWIDSKDPARRRCAWGLMYEFSKLKTKKAPDDGFFLECVDRIDISMSKERDMWVREAMNTALMGIGIRNKKLNGAAIKACKTMGPTNIDYGDDNSCEPLDVMKHLTGDSVKRRLAK